MKALAVLLLAFQLAKPVKIADGFDPATAGLAAAGGYVFAWDRTGVRVFARGTMKPVDVGLDGIRDVISIAPGEFLAVLTRLDAELWVKRGGRFERLNLFVPEGAYNKAVWVDYDHDGLPDLFLLGDKSVLLRNDGAGFTNVSNNFPFVQGRAVDGAVENGDVVVRYSDRPGVRYVDQGGGRWEAEEMTGGPAKPRAGGASLEIDQERLEIRQDGWLVRLREAE